MTTGQSIGYARTSTLEQTAGLDAQREALTAIGCDKVFHEQTSARAAREALRSALDYSREGDLLVVTKLDRLARSVRDLGNIIAELERKGVGLKIIDLGLDTTSATGRLMLNILGSVAEFEVSLMLERQREGIAKAKAEGRYKGRTPTAIAKADEVKSLIAQGKTKRQAAASLGISERSVYRCLRI